MHDFERVEVFETRCDLRKSFLRLQCCRQVHELVRRFNQVGQRSRAKIKSNVQEVIVAFLAEV